MKSKEISRVSSEIVSQFSKSCRLVVEHGLTRCSSGNMSLRVDAELMLVKSSRSWMGHMDEADVSVCRIADGALLEGGKPSVETGFHAGVLRTRPDMNVVLHFQSPCATTLACMDGQVPNYFVIPEVPFYIGPVARIPYLCPGSKELADAVTDALREHDLVQMVNHGQTTVATDVAHAIQNASFFEMACAILLRGGERIAPLTAEQAGALLALKAARNSAV